MDEPIALLQVRDDVAGALMNDWAPGSPVFQSVSARERNVALWCDLEHHAAALAIADLTLKITA